MWDTKTNTSYETERCYHCHEITSADVCPNGCESCSDCGEQMVDGICPDCDIKCDKCHGYIVDNECNCPKPVEKIYPLGFCQTCGSNRIFKIDGKSSDRNLAEYQGKDMCNMYVPSNLNIGGNNCIIIHVCLDCGQLQGEWPVQDPDIFDEEEE